MKVSALPWEGMHVRPSGRPCAHMPPICHQNVDSVWSLSTIWAQNSECFLTFFYVLRENLLNCRLQEPVQRISGQWNILLGHLRGGYWFLPSGAHQYGRVDAAVWLKNPILDLFLGLFIVLRVEQRCRYAMDSAGICICAFAVFAIFAVFTSPNLWSRILSPFRSTVYFNPNHI